MRTQAIKMNNNNIHSSTNSTPSQPLPIIPGEPFEIKVEITPPVIPDSIPLTTSFSMDSSNGTNLNISIPEYQSKSSSISPQQRKLSELSQDGLLNPANFNRLNPSSSGGSVNRLFRRIEDMMDLSSPYNHYKCLSPSESNLVQCSDIKMQYNTNSKFDSNNKPGSTRLLRRQFSLDKDDAGSSVSNQKQINIELFQEKCNLMNQMVKSQQTRGLHKQNSSEFLAQDLEKIEEIPISPPSSSTDNNSNRSLNSSQPSSIIVMTTNENENLNNEKGEIKLNVESLLLR